MALVSSNLSLLVKTEAHTTSIRQSSRQKQQQQQPRINFPESRAHSGKFAPRENNPLYGNLLQILTNNNYGVRI